MKWLWLRHSYTFNWAHKPLCERYARDVLRIGRIHVCRSCACVYAGVALGIIVAGLGLARAFVLAGYGIALPVIIALSLPALYRKLPRSVRDVVRLLTGTLLALTVYVSIVFSPVAGAVGLVIFASAWVIYTRLRAAQKMHACDGCRELGGDHVCSGYALQAACIRRYEREATDYLLATGYVPLAGRRLDPRVVADVEHRPVPPEGQGRRLHALNPRPVAPERTGRSPSAVRFC